jgi:hypothetical protein
MITFRYCWSNKDTSSLELSVSILMMIMDLVAKFYLEALTQRNNLGVWSVCLLYLKMEVEALSSTNSLPYQWNSIYRPG